MKAVILLVDQFFFYHKKDNPKGSGKPDVFRTEESFEGNGQSLTPFGKGGSEESYIKKTSDEMNNIWKY